MYLLFDSAGKFQAGRILSETDTSAQVELETGKRVKVKQALQLLRFDAPEPPALLAAAAAEAATVDPALAWEFAPEEEFGFADLAADYYGAAPSVLQQVAALLALHDAPHYFRRAAKGRFRKAPADIVARALAAIEKKKQIAAQVSAWSAELAAGTCPEPIRAQLYKILFKPDKNAPEYKAVVEAARSTQLAPLALLTHAGAITSAYQFHWQRFLFENFPEGTAFPELPALPAAAPTLPLAAVAPFSIDDAHTTEIDDALSVQGLGSGQVIVGIHIAAPGLVIRPGDAIDQICRARLSTVYMPGYKITMLPPELVQRFTLQAGQPAAALSLYVTLDEQTLQVRHTETRLERITLAANLRHENLNDQGLADPAIPLLRDPALPAPHNLWAQLDLLLRFARQLLLQREQVRGKPFPPSRPDYSFTLDNPEGSAPTGAEHVAIHPRPRGAPLDLIVSEMMILANSTWGGWLKELGLPGIYRTQPSLVPGVKVRLSTKALLHAGMGVAYYAWSTSPLRRYVDLANQWQLIAAAEHGNTALLAAPFKPRDTALMTIISAFDGTYSAYQHHQSGMERYWALRFLQQEGIRTVSATLIKETNAGTWLVRADALPLIFSVLGAQGLPRGTHVAVTLGDIDLIALDVRGSVTGILGNASLALESDDEDEQDAAGPVAVAMDVNAPEEPAGEAPAA